MTSLERELGHAPAGGLDAFAELMARCFRAAHGRAPATVSPEHLDTPAPEHGLAIA
jgi:hypothetical protein